MPHTPDQLTPHFRLSEFRCPCCNAADPLAALLLAQQLQKARDEYGTINIISGFRCARHNATVGGKANSQHLFGLAADIVIQSDADRHDLTTALIHAGFLRLGLAVDFVHADIGTITGPVLWLY